MASSIWSTLKAAAPTFGINTVPAPDPEQHHHHHHSKQHPVDKSSSSSFANSISRVLGTGATTTSTTITTPPSPIPHSLPRSTSSPGEFRGTQSQNRSSPTTAVPPPLPHPTRKTPSRLSLSFSAGGQKEKEKEKEERKDREREQEKETEHHKNAEVTGHNTAAANGTGTVGVNPQHAPAPPPLLSPNPALDPLSQQIFMRRNTEHSLPRRSMHMEGIARSSSDFLRAVTPSVGDATKDKSKKGGSFLSRLSMRGGRKKELGDLDSDSELGVEARVDGTNARVFSQTVSNPVVGGGYAPRHKEPPRYIRTKASNKKTREFNRMFLAQELIGTRPPTEGEPLATESNKAPVVTVSVAGGGERKTERSGGAIWATEFSRDGKYLATAGRDHVVRVWAVITTPEERRAHEDDEAANGGARERLSAPVFRDQPIAEFQGHTGEVLDLSWSKNNFLLSSSMDKTVRLWHLSRPECLCTFKHKDFVTRLAFHPCDDRFFLAGSLDTMLRLWSIPDKAVAFSAQLPDLVTAVAFSPDGKTAIAGLLNGLCVFFETEGLKQQNQIHVRSSRGKNAKGSKITGIQTMVIPPLSLPTLPSLANISSGASHASTEVPSGGEVRVLVTSNDSRIRIYSLSDNSLDIKLKGHENTCSQIAASFSDDGKYVICGSEDRKAFVWSLTCNDAVTMDKDKSPCESFEAHGEIVTTAVFAPTKTRMLLGQSGDPLYDLCNPPPVVLQSLDEVASAAASQIALSTNGSHLAPAPTSESLFKRPEPSPAYIARSRHHDGNIIITTSDTGIIKVFRQDCAFSKRRNETWETGSTFSRKLAAPKTNGLGRSISVMTRTSASSGVTHSRRGSVSQSIVPGSAIGSPQLGAVGGNSDMILTWRQGIEDGGDRRSSAILTGGGSTNERPVSPSKGKRTPLGSTVNLPGSASEARRQPYANSITTTATNRNRAGSTLTSPTASVFSNTPSRVPSRVPSMLIGRRRPSKGEDDTISVPPTPSFIFRSASGSENDHPLELAKPGSGGGGGTSFWSLNKWRGITGFKTNSSSNQDSQEAVVNPGRKSTGSRSSLTKRRGNDDDESGDEKPKEKACQEEQDKAAKRQSTGLLPAAQVIRSSGEVDRLTSLPASAKSQEIIGDSSSDVMSIPTDSARGMIPPMNPIQARRDASPYRHLWSRGTTATSTSHASRMSSDVSSDVIGEGLEGGDAEEQEMTCKACGGKEFKAKKIGGKQKLSCGRCGKVAA